MCAFSLCYMFCQTVSHPHLQKHCNIFIPTPPHHPSVPPWSHQYTSPSIFLPFCAVSASSAVNLLRVIHPLINAVCNNHEPRRCCLVIIIMICRLHGLVDAAPRKNSALYDLYTLHFHRYCTLRMDNPTPTSKIHGASLWPQVSELWKYSFWIIHLVFCINMHCTVRILEMEQQSNISSISSGKQTHAFWKTHLGKCIKITHNNILEIELCRRSSLNHCHAKRRGKKVRDYWRC